uniref:Uncharacterized protein n=1 Tax=Oryza punctata TaxID=4537 RepID=A0A0E0K2S9_ORYPU
MSEGKIIISFPIVALASFLCLNSSVYPSIKCLTTFEDVKRLEFFDWSNFIYEWLVKLCQKVSQVQQDMITIYSELDKVDNKNYGLMPLKDFSETCYAQHNSSSFRDNWIQL